MNCDSQAAGLVSRRRLFHSSFAAVWCVVLTAALAAAADTVRVTVERALVWNRPSGVSVVLTQLSRGQTAEVVRRVDEWYEIVIPGADRRTGFVRAAQVELIPGAAGTPQSGRRPTTPARPPAGQPKVPRIYASIDGGYRIGSHAFTRSSEAFESTFAEAGTIEADYGKGAGFAFDLMGAYRVTRHLGFGVGVSSYTRPDTVKVSATIPHPLYFNRPREATFEDDALNGKEIGVHVSVLWSTPINRSTDITLFGGPSFFSYRQDVVVDVKLASQYPYDEASIVGTTSEEQKGSAVGFHAGLDVTRYFNPNIGFGVSARFSRAELTFDDDDETASVSGFAGGAQVSIGLRFKF